MTVRELIAALVQVKNPDAEVGAYLGCSNGYGTIAKVKYITDMGIAALVEVGDEDVEEFISAMKTIDEQENREACTH